MNNKLCNQQTDSRLPHKKFNYAGIINLAAVAMITLGLISCAETGSDIGSSGSSGTGAPDSIIGYKLVQTVTGNDGKPTTISVGREIIYEFISSTTIYSGGGLAELPTTSWSYSASGDTGIVRLNYDAGYSVETLKFTSSTGGTYTSFSELNSGTTGDVSGTFIITGSGTAADDTGTDGACTETTGQLTIYTSVGDEGSIAVSVDGSSAGTLSSYYTTGGPTCGTSDSGTITRTLSAGSHSVSATSDTGSSWGPTSQSITACECLTLELF